MPNIAISALPVATSQAGADVLPIVQATTSTTKQLSVTNLFTSPTFVTPILGTPSSGTVTNLTGTASININGTVGATTPASGAFTTVSATGVATFAAGTVALPSITTTGDTNTGVYFPAADTVGITVGGTQRGEFSSAGLAVTGAGSFTAATGIVSVNSTTGTNAAYQSFSNTGGNYFVGVDSSAGAIFSATAYALVRYAPTGKVIQDIIGGAGIVTTVSATGLAVTGTLNSTGKQGYATGAGGTVTQATSKATGVTLSKSTGQITLAGDALNASTTVSFTLTNTVIEAGDILVMNHISAGTAGSYLLNAQSAAGSASINVRNISLGSLSEAIVIAFAVIKAVTA